MSIGSPLVNIITSLNSLTIVVIESINKWYVFFIALFFTLCKPICLSM